jgi:hypothetical protein
MKLDQSILILIQVLIYMVSITTTIFSNIFYNLCSSLLSYALFLYILYSYNENNNTIHTREISWVFPPTTLNYLIKIKDPNYFIFITINTYNWQMRAMLKICITIPKTFKRKYIFSDITLMFHLLNFIISWKCVLVYIQLSSTCDFFVDDAPSSVLTQHKHLVAYHSETPLDTIWKCPNYEKEMYSIVQACH